MELSENEIKIQFVMELRDFNDSLVRQERGKARTESTTRFVERHDISKLGLVKRVATLFFAKNVAPTTKEILETYEEGSLDFSVGVFTRSFLWRKAEGTRGFGLVGKDKILKKIKRGRSYGFYPSALIYRDKQGRILLDMTEENKIIDKLSQDNFLQTHVYVWWEERETPLISLLSWNIPLQYVINIARERGGIAMKGTSPGIMLVGAAIHSIETRLQSAPPIPQYILKESFALLRLLKDLESCCVATVRCLKEIKNGTADIKLIAKDLRRHCDEIEQLLIGFEKTISESDIGLLLQLPSLEGREEEVLDAYNIATFLPNEMQFLAQRVTSAIERDELHEDDLALFEAYKEFLSRTIKEFSKYISRSLRI